MASSPASSAANAAELSLLAFCAAVGCLLPPFNERIASTPAVVVLLSLAIACSLILHLVFVGYLARAHGRSAGRYAALALVTLPVGSIVGLVLYEWAQRHATAGPTVDGSTGGATPG